MTARRSARAQEIALPLVVVALIIAGTILKGSVFFSTANLWNVLVQASVAGTIAVGMTFVIATGGIDLAVGSVMAAAAIVGGHYFASAGSAAFMLATVVAAVVLGAINGIAVAWLRIVPFVATLAMFAAARGIAHLISHQTPVALYGLDALTRIGSQRVLGIPIPAIVFLVVVALGWLVLDRTRYGRYVIAVGGNREAARIAGIRVRPIVFSVYAVVGLCTGIASVLQTGQLASASPVVGLGLELDAIAAVVIGGTSLAGGRCTMIGTFFGVITFALVFNLLTLENVESQIQQILRGVIILGAVVVQRRGH
ncbi:MAG TPA: ABC transporter permease [Kofleriaceae bacterium]|jgi:ribose/xylose/arabinose/galactoside ABC-type transport system permease subunit|nr:ABC transporter permease [Kofleriaceae bacterium]